VYLTRLFPRAEDGIFLFVLGIAVITLFTRRTLVEALPSAGISSSGLILVAFPLSYAVRLSRCWHPRASDAALCDGYYLGGDTAAYFVGDPSASTNWRHN